MRSIFFLFTLTFCLTYSCSIDGLSFDDIDEETPTELCLHADPLNELSWLNEIAADFAANLATGERILQYRYRDSITVYYVINACCDQYNYVYDCEMNELCRFGGFAGENTCPDFENQVTEEKVLYEDEEASLVFGHYYGMCGGEECVEMFKLTPTQLYEDVTDEYPGVKFSFELLDQQAFTKADGLLEAMPDALLAVQNGTIGCPDCADQGGLYVRYHKVGETVRSWRIDQDKQQTPAEIHAFTDRINQTIQAINQ